MIDTLANVIDLHSHSNFSDGSETPREVVRLASEAGCSAIALTDHDGLDGLGEAHAEADRLGITLVDGCEVSCDLDGRALHVLCYFVTPGDGPLQQELVRLKSDRVSRNAVMVTKLQELGLPITSEEVTDEAGGRGIGRPHFAAVLMRHGVVTSIGEAFDRYLGEGKPGYVKRSRVPIELIIDLTHSSGGVAVVAHPLSLDLEASELERNVIQWKESGLDGLESYYSRYTDEQRKGLIAMARRNDLVPTGGSDFHGAYKPDIAVGKGTGDLFVPDEVLDELCSRRG